MWAAACTDTGIQGAGYSFKAKSFHGLLRIGLVPGVMVLHVLIHIHSICLVQERLLEMNGAVDWLFHRSMVLSIKLESLILAQNERWRHA